MALIYGSNLGLLESAATGEAHDTALRALLRGLDVLVQPVVKQALLNTPPASPSNGDSYIVGTAPTGAWAGQGNKVARYSSVTTGWDFFTPKQGWKLYDQTTSTRYEYTGSAWTQNQTIGGPLTLSGSSATPLIVNSTAAAGHYLSWRNSGTDVGYVGSGSNTVPSAALGDFVLHGVTKLHLAAANAIKMTLDASSATLGVPLTINSTDFYLTNGAATNTRFRVSALAGSERGLLILTNASARWEFIGSSDAESGSDAGTNFMIRARNDSGTVIDSPINITRASAGAIALGGFTARPVTMSGTLSVSGASNLFGTTSLAATLRVGLATAAGQQRSIDFNSGSAGRWSIICNATVESGSDAGSNFQLNAYNDAGVSIDSPLSISRASGGTMTFGGTSNRPAVFNGYVQVDGAAGKGLRYANATANGAVATTLGSVGPTGSTAGNPQGWLRVSINGTDRYVPFW